MQGDSDDTPWVREEMGRVAVEQLDMALTEKETSSQLWAALQWQLLPK